MNKLMGFYELKDMNIPSVPWREYTGAETLQADCLWSVRCAVFRGDDLNLPRKIGVPASEAVLFANRLLKELDGKGIVVYYPYFLANKSGTLNVFPQKVVIEAVLGDLWNMVTYSDRNVTLQFIDGEKIIDGDRDFLSPAQINGLMDALPKIRYAFKNELLAGKSVLLEWSYAQKCGLNKKPIGEEYLVFYEARSVT